jgi:hypothetical protein
MLKILLMSLLQITICIYEYWNREQDYLFRCLFNDTNIHLGYVMSNSGIIKE